MRSSLFAVAAVIAVSAAALARADVAATPRMIDVVVTDASGKHVTGLTQGDFEILEDGAHRDIASFSADAQPPRSYLFVIDSSTLTLAARKSVVAAVRDFINQHVRPIDQINIASISPSSGVSSASQWTSNKDAALKALDAVEASAIGNKSFERREAERAIQLALDQDRDSSAPAPAAGGSGGRPGGGAIMQNRSQITFDQIMQPGRQYAEAMRQRTFASIDSVRDALTMLRSGPGKKVAIIAGGGLSTHPGSDIFQYLDEVRQRVMAGAAGGAGALKGAQTTNPLAEVSRYDVTKEVREIAESARDRGITIYTIDSENSGSSDSSIERTADATASKDYAGVSDLMSGYLLLTTTTGGTSTGGRGATSLAQIAGDLGSHYLLTYTQTLNDKGALPKLAVRTTKPGARVRFGYAGGPSTKDSEVKDVVVSNFTAANLTNDLNIAVKNEEPAVEGDAKRVKLHILIPLKSLKFTTADAEANGGFIVYVSTGDPTGNASAVDRQTKELHFPAEKLPQLLDKTINFVVDVVLIPGRTEISVGVIDQQSQRTGYAKATI